MKIPILKITFIIFSLLILSSCATTELKVNTKLTKTIILDHSSKEESKVFIQVSNTSIEKDTNYLKKQISALLISKGYKIVESSSRADFELFVNTLFANNIKEAHNIASSIGIGVSAGVISKVSGHNTGDSLLVGATIALAGIVIGKALEDDTYRSVVDIEIREYSKNHIKKKSKAYKIYKTRSLLELVKMNLNLEEALPLMEKRLAIQISKIF